MFPTISGNNAGMVLDFGELQGSEVLFKIALSYTHRGYAIENLNIIIALHF